MKHNNKGFSLVELIVVIAIMAILVGVAIPVYTGYVEKAQNAADEQLLATINQSFDLACVELGIEESSITSATWNMEQMTITDVNGDTQHAVIAAFRILFSDSNAKFNNITALRYDKDLKAFVSETRIKFEYNGNTYWYNGEDKENFIASFFGSMDSADLLGDVDNVVDWAVIKLGGGNAVLAGVEREPAFLAFVKETFGVEYATLSESQKINAMVLYTSKQTDEIDSEQILNDLKANPGIGLPGTYTESSVELADYAMRYALALAFYREKNPTVQNPSVDDVFAAAMERGTDGEDLFGEPIPSEKTYFQEWLEENGQANVDGYLGAMNTISGNTGNIDANEMLQNGFASNELVGMLDQFTGKNNP